ncbi:PspC domain-containing protein [Corynebacterium pseudodiphtheriticum]|uniref:PspC domain-containing protein n=1 Tax=Corynebacterium pseudodiphtheriticum TaxID=37637 RepID=A0AAP4F505_9CORY|nr:PspC domain-containing protein [Corynebacterium pseudodiphtheriticum]MDK4228407.1 PspC domain-containing protein [Corynebacterium pseudodiphtheriticum]MDK4306419.1 PspC domain-containing protein [Corynebacterium pseudodiphtheriticum]
MTYPGSQWHRTDRNKLIAGVCAGVAETYGVKADTVRLIYLLALLVWAFPVITAYLIQWLIYPKR